MDHVRVCIAISRSAAGSQAEGNRSPERDRAFELFRRRSEEQERYVLQIFVPQNSHVRVFVTLGNETHESHEINLELRHGAPLRLFGVTPNRFSILIDLKI